MLCCTIQEKVMGNLEKEGKSAKPAAGKKPAAGTDGKPAKGAEPAEVEEEDPVEKELLRYGVITENPWEKGVK